MLDGLANFIKLIEEYGELVFGIENREPALMMQFTFNEKLQNEPVNEICLAAEMSA